MPAEKNWPVGVMKNFGGRGGDAELGAAGVGNQRVGSGVLGDFRQQIECDADGQREVDEVSVADRDSEFRVMGFVNGAKLFCFAYDLGAVPSGDA